MPITEKEREVRPVEKCEDLDDRAIRAKTKPAEMERLISDFKPFFHSRASKYSSNNSGFEQDELFGIAMAAFYEAITAYDDSKGHFFPFASNVVRCNILDHIRKVYRSERREPVLAGDWGENSASPICSASVRAHDEIKKQRCIVDEIEQFKYELANWGITMESLALQSPKHKKLAEVYKLLVRQILQKPDVIQTIQLKHYFPIKRISEISGLPQKKLERARTFIIASLIIKMGDYDFLSEYIA